MSQKVGSHRGSYKSRIPEDHYLRVCESNLALAKQRGDSREIASLLCSITQYKSLKGSKSHDLNGGYGYGKGRGGFVKDW